MQNPRVYEEASSERYSCDRDLTTVTEHGTVYLIPLGHPTIRLNRSASTIWIQLIERGQSLGAVVAAYSREFGCPSDQAREEVVQLVDQLAGGHLISPVEG